MQLPNELFISGTDTDVGKTLVSSGILQVAGALGLSTVGYKPVSAGCEVTPQGLRNQDALALQANSTLHLGYELINPIAFADPVAPHLAAQKANVSISLDTLSAGFQVLKDASPDLILVEGAGGWRLPLGNGVFMSDFVKQHKLPVVLVVGLKLGCLNHALLSVEAIQADGLDLVGWIGSQIDKDMLYLNDNIAALHDLIPAPNLGIIPYLEDKNRARDFLNITF